jgi:hypothetical protein
MNNMAEQAFVLELPLEAQRLLADNSIDLIKQLRADHLSVRQGGLPPGVPPAEGAKEVVLTILAVGITGSLLAGAVAKILDALGRNKKFVATEHELVPVMDRSGEPVLNANGEPVLYWSEKARMVESARTSQSGSTSSIEAKAGPLLIKFSTTDGK